MLENILLAILFGGIFTLAFGGFGWFLLSRYRAARREVAQSVNWPSVPGRITFSSVSDIVPDHSLSDDLNDSHRARNEYAYSVNGIDYLGNRVAFTAGATFSGSRRDADAIVQRYHVNAPVNVFFNPQNPGDSVLEKAVGSNTGFLVLMVIPLLLGMTSCGISVWVILSEILKSVG